MLSKAYGPSRRDSSEECIAFGDLSVSQITRFSTTRYSCPWTKGGVLQLNPWLRGNDEGNRDYHVKLHRIRGVIRALSSILDHVLLRCFIRRRGRWEYPQGANSEQGAMKQLVNKLYAARLRSRRRFRRQSNSRNVLPISCPTMSVIETLRHLRFCSSGFSE